MPVRTCVLFAFLAASPAFSQVAPAAVGGVPEDDNQMMTPPPVSGVPYANTIGSETRTNFLGAGITVTPAYIDNVLPEVTAAPVSDTTVSIAPNVSFDRTTPREIDQFDYDPTFTLYEPTSSLNAFDQNASVRVQYRFSPEVAINVQDKFLRTSNVFGQSYPFSNAITGSVQPAGVAVIAPFVEQLVNSTNGILSYQFSRNSMVGGGGSYDLYDFPDPTKSEGLFNSNGVGGVAFYNRRLSGGQYAGFIYNYSRILAYVPSGQVGFPEGHYETQIHSLLPFYTFYFNRTSSLSLSGGAQRLGATQAAFAPASSWSPTVIASLGWQGNRGDIAANYTYGLTAGGGLIGAYKSSGISGSGGLELARGWNAAAAVSYASINAAATGLPSSVQNGSTITGQASLEHSMGEHFTATVGYQHLHENYPAVQVIAADPDSNREFVTVTYQFQRPVGR